MMRKAWQILNILIGLCALYLTFGGYVDVRNPFAVEAAHD